MPQNVEAPSQNFALDMVRVTEAGALHAARWLGKGERAAGERAAMEAVRRSFLALVMDGTLAVAPAERGRPLLFERGERIGLGTGPTLDVALDPVEGSILLALGRPNAICVAAVAPTGSLYTPLRGSYMQKIVVPEAAGQVLDDLDLDAPVNVILERTAKALGKDVDDLAVFVLDKPRHEELIRDIRAAGARILLHSEGDVAGALMAATPKPKIDLLLGIGGAAEGVVTACALRGMGGRMLAKLAPQSEEERQALLDAGQDPEHRLTEKDLASCEDTFFACTGISTGPLLDGVRFDGRGAQTHSLVCRGKTGTVRYIQSRHSVDKLLRGSGPDA